MSFHIPVVANKDNPVTLQKKTLVFGEWLSLVYDIHFKCRRYGMPCYSDEQIIQKLDAIIDLEPQFVWVQIHRYSGIHVTLDNLFDLLGLMTRVCSYLEKGNRHRLAEQLWNNLKEEANLHVFDKYDPTFLRFLGEEIVAGKLRPDRPFWERLLDQTHFVEASMALLLVKYETALGRARVILKNASLLGMPQEQINPFWLRHHHLILDLAGHKAFPHLMPLDCLDDGLFCQIVGAVSNFDDGDDLLEAHELMIPLREYLKRSSSSVAADAVSVMNCNKLSNSLSSLNPKDSTSLTKLFELIDRFCSLEKDALNLKNLEENARRISGFLISKNPINSQKFTPIMLKWFKLINHYDTLPCFDFDDLITQSLEKSFPKEFSREIILKFSTRFAMGEHRIVKVIHIVARTLLMKQRKPAELSPLLIQRLCRLPVEDAPIHNQDLMKSLLSVCRHIKDTEEFVPLFRKLLELLKRYESISKLNADDELVKRCFELGKALKVWNNPEDRDLVSAISTTLKAEAAKSDIAALESARDAAEVKQIILSKAQSLRSGPQDNSRTAIEMICNKVIQLLNSGKSLELDLAIEILTLEEVSALLFDPSRTDQGRVLLKMLFEQENVLTSSALESIIGLIIKVEPIPGTLWQTLFETAVKLKLPEDVTNKEAFAPERMILYTFGSYCRQKEIDLLNQTFYEIRRGLFALTKKLCIEESFWLVCGLDMLFRLVNSLSPEANSEQLVAFLSDYIELHLKTATPVREEDWPSLKEIYKTLMKTDYPQLRPSEFSALETNLFYLMCLCKMVNKYGGDLFKNMIMNPHIPDEMQLRQRFCIAAYVDAACSSTELALFFIPRWFDAIGASLNRGIYNNVACQIILIKVCGLEDKDDINRDSLIHLMKLYLETELIQKRLPSSDLIPTLLSFISTYFTDEGYGGPHAQNLISLLGQLITFIHVKDLMNSDSLNLLIDQLVTMVLFYHLGSAEDVQKDAKNFFAAVNKYIPKKESVEIIKPDFKKIQSQVDALDWPPALPHEIMSQEQIFMGALQSHSLNLSTYIVGSKPMEELHKELERNLRISMGAEGFKQPATIIPLNGKYRTKFNAVFIEKMLKLNRQNPSEAQFLLLYAFDLIMKFTHRNPKHINEIAKLCDCFLVTPLARQDEVEKLHDNLCALITIRFRSIKLPETIRLKYRLYFDQTTDIQTIASPARLTAGVELCHALLTQPTINTLKKTLHLMTNIRLKLESSGLLIPFIQAFFSLVDSSLGKNANVVSLFDNIPNALQLSFNALSNDAVTLEGKLAVWESLLVYHNELYKRSAGTPEKISTFCQFLDSMKAPLRAGWLTTKSAPFVEKKVEYAALLNEGVRLLSAQLKEGNGDHEMVRSYLDLAIELGIAKQS